MNPQLIPKLARWAGVAALAVILVAAGIFAQRQWLALKETPQAPAAVPSSVQQQSLKFTFSKTDGQQTVFTIHAARATEYRDATGSVLEDVDIVVYGEHGDRHDEIHTRSCEYEPRSGAIVCHGTVELNLSSLPLGKATKAPVPGGGIHVETQGVSFNRDTGMATTESLVTFQFPQGEGSGIGADYSSRGADFLLRRSVKIALTPKGDSGVPTRITSDGGMTFDRTRNRLSLAGPVEIRQGDRVIEAHELTIDLSNRLRPERAVTGGKTRVKIAQGSRRGSLQANGAEILFDREGRAIRINASGGVTVVGQEPETKIQAQRAAIFINPANQQPRTVEFNGNVRFQVGRPSGELRLASQSLQLTATPAPVSAALPSFQTGEAKSRVESLNLAQATTPGEAHAEWISQDGDVQLKAGRLAAVFGPNNQIQTLRGSGDVRLERRQPGQLPLLTTAKELVVNFASGRWAVAQESGGVHVAQGARSGQADQAIWLRAEDQIELDRGAVVNDPSGQTSADTIVWNRKTGDLRATGHVRSTYTGGGEDSAAGPVNIVAATLDANAKRGEAVYSGSARLWQGDLVVQADRIELQRASRELVAAGNVLAAFPQAIPQMQAPTNGNTARGLRAAPTGKTGARNSPVLWRVRSSRLRYTQQTGTKTASDQPASSPKFAGEVTLTGGVAAWSSQGRIQAKTLTLRLDRDGNGRSEMTEATGSGGVTVRQGARWGTAENARYDAAHGQFVLWGGKPSLQDASGDFVTGSRLTFSVANDTILVESSEGSRTLTRHPVTN